MWKLPDITTDVASQGMPNPHSLSHENRCLIVLGQVNLGTHAGSKTSLRARGLQGVLSKILLEAPGRKLPPRVTASAHAAAAAAGQADSSQPTSDFLAAFSRASFCHSRSAGSASASTKLITSWKSTKTAGNTLNTTLYPRGEMSQGGQ